MRLAEESAKPNAERLREYSEAGLDSLKLQLFSDAPIYDDLETVKLADSLGMMDEIMGGGQRTGENGAGRQIAARPRRGIGSRHQAQGCRRSQAPGRRRPEGHRRFDTIP